MKRSIKDRILQILIKPSTVTEIKNKIPELKSFGTLSYHLKQLENDHIITKEKQAKKQGQPTFYKLVDQKTKNILDKMEALDTKIKIAALKIVKEHPNISDDHLVNALVKQGFDSELAGDITMGLVGDNLTELQHEITIKGEKFLKENDKK